MRIVQSLNNIARSIACWRYSMREAVAALWGYWPSSGSVLACNVSSKSQVSAGIPLVEAERRSRIPSVPRPAMGSDDQAVDASESKKVYGILKALDELLEDATAGDPMGAFQFWGEFRILSGVPQPFRGTHSKGAGVAYVRPHSEMHP